MRPLRCLTLRLQAMWRLLWLVVLNRRCRRMMLPSSCLGSHMRASSRRAAAAAARRAAALAPPRSLLAARSWCPLAHAALRVVTLGGLLLPLFVRCALSRRHLASCRLPAAGVRRRTLPFA